MNDWRHFGAFDFFRPLALDRQKSADRRSTNLRLIGRRSDKLSATTPPVSSPIRRASRRRFPRGERRERLAHCSAQQQRRVEGTAAKMVAMLIGVSAFVLLIAC